MNLNYDSEVKNTSKIKYGIDEILTIYILKYLIDNNINVLVYKEKDFENKLIDSISSPDKLVLIGDY